MWQSLILTQAAELKPASDFTYPIYKFELGAVPGVSAFITNEVALEISVGLLGFDYQKVVQVTNQVEKSQMEKSGANFKINLFSINFGMSFYLPTGQHRPKKNKN